MASKPIIKYQDISLKRIISLIESKGYKNMGDFSFKKTTMYGTYQIGIYNGDNKYSYNLLVELMTDKAFANRKKIKEIIIFELSVTEYTGQIIIHNDDKLVKILLSKGYKLDTKGNLKNNTFEISSKVIGEPKYGHREGTKIVEMTIRKLKPNGTTTSEDEFNNIVTLEKKCR